LTFFGLWLSTQFSLAVQNYVAYGLILTFGILHGANDMTLISSVTAQKKSFKPLFLNYLGAVVLVSLLFLVSRGFALLFFILISAYHFGEQHLSMHLRNHHPLNGILYMLYGFVVLFMIFSIKLNESILIIEDISGWLLSERLFISVWIGSFAGLVFLFFLLITDRVLNIHPIKEMFYLVVLAITFAHSSLIWGFAIYFIFWHSLPSLKDQLHFLYGSATKTNFFHYVKSSSLYWLISIAGLGLLYWMLKDSVDYFITVILYVLAAITFPHVLVMSKVEALRK